MRYLITLLVLSCFILGCAAQEKGLLFEERVFEYKNMKVTLQNDGDVKILDTETDDEVDLNPKEVQRLIEILTP